MSKLIIARHGATSYNEAGLWTGLTDIDMSEAGYEDVEKGAEIVAKYTVGVALSSVLMRARNTAKVALAHQNNNNVPLIETPLLNEKDYGVFTGKSKEEVRASVGQEVFMQIRRSWDYPIEDGESLKDVHSRIMPIHKRVVIPILESGQTVYIASHNNTLRAMVKELEGIPDDRASGIELGTAEVRVYDYDGGGFICDAVHTIGAVH